jgi:hypothetical protein
MIVLLLGTLSLIVLTGPWRKGRPGPRSIERPAVDLRDRGYW